MNTPSTEPARASLALLNGQRSHLLFVWSNAKDGRQSEFLDWYRGSHRGAVAGLAGVVGVQQYEQHEVDITLGRYQPPPFKYLGLYELSLDGAQAADGVIGIITEMHQQQAATDPPATWLYYPVSEKVGRAPALKPVMLTLAFANGIGGREREFREWYATRHIRHALNIPALISGQCFERTQFQRPGVLESSYDTIAVYEQEGSAKSILESFAVLPPQTFDFPTLDVARFTEWTYRPV